MKLSTQIILAFSIVILLSAADSYTNYLLSKKVQQNSDFLSNSESIIRNSNRTHKVIIDMQSSFRGYLLTDDSTFLNVYYSGIKSVPAYIKEQKWLVGDNTQQQAILDSIGSMHAYWVEYSGQLIDSRKKEPSSYRKLFESRLKKHVGKKINDEIAQKFIRFDKIEYAARKHHSAALLSSIATTHTISLIFLGLTIVIGIVTTIYIVIIISKRIASMVRMAEDISAGRFTSVKDTKNDELTGLSRSLNVMSAKLNKNIRELETRNAELNKFAYVVSHDLKAPIRGIHNVITWIQEDLQHELSPELKRYLQIIPQRTQRMEALINGLLDYARISLKTPVEEVNVDILVREIADSIIPRSFTVEIDTLPCLRTERLKLEQVFANLISNAVKYTKASEGQIRITCRDLGTRFEFSVIDNGIGIEPEFHGKIFEIFQTLREKDEKESTGVGLAIVKKIIDEHHETINVQSKPGEGTAFTFTWKNNYEQTYHFTD